MVVTLKKLALGALVIATTASGSVLPDLVERAAAPSVENGNFNAPFKGTWYFEQLGARITRANYDGNYAMQIGNVDCEDEEYAEAFGRIVNTAGGKKYTLSFDYQFSEDTGHVAWGMSYFRASGCDPCNVYFFNNVHFTHTVVGGTWYTWSGDFIKPKNFGSQDLTVEVDLNTCGYSGTTLLDNFTITSK